MDKSLIEIMRKNKIENLLGFISKQKNILTSYIGGKRFVMVGIKKIICQHINMRLEPV